MNLHLGHGLDIRRLRIFQTAAEYEHFSRAAAALHISEPAVSVQIRELERHLGVALFERVGRGVRLTAAGDLVHTYTQRLLAMADELEQAVAEKRALDGSRLHIGASTTPGAYLLPSVLNMFRERHSALRITVDIGNTATTVERLRDGTVHLGLIGKEIHDAELHLEPWIEDELQLILPPGHRWTDACVSCEDLGRESIVRREEGSATDQVVTDALATAGLAMRRGLVLGGNEAVKQAVANGLGVAFVSTRTAAAELSVGRLARCTLEGLTLTRTFQLARRRGVHLSAAERAFIAIARAVNAAT